MPQMDESGREARSLNVSATDKRLEMPRPTGNLKTSRERSEISTDD